jgi:hypothetical protein
MTVAAGLAVAFFVAAVRMLGLAVVDDRLYNRLDVERIGAPLLIEIPKLSKKQARQVVKRIKQGKARG